MNITCMHTFAHKPSRAVWSFTHELSLPVHLASLPSLSSLSIFHPLFYPFSCPTCIWIYTGHKLAIFPCYLDFSTPKHAHMYSYSLFSFYFLLKLASPSLSFPYLSLSTPPFPQQPSANEVWVSGCSEKLLSWWWGSCLCSVPQASQIQKATASYLREEKRGGEERREKMREER